MKARPEMRLKTFTTAERAVLIPIELIAALKTACIVLPVPLLICGVTGTDEFWSNVVSGPGLVAALGVLSAILGGAVLTPLLLPWLPGRAFSLKGGLVGTAAATLFQLLHGPDPETASGIGETVAWFLLIPSVTSYLAMNFTGASTFTSLSGVQREMRWAFPAQVGSGAMGACLWLAARFFS
jgi:acetyl-CoA decarbonylase/synthase complex subunit gamma